MKIKKDNILNKTNLEILWTILKKDLELRNTIKHCLDEGSKISAIKHLKHHTEETGTADVVPSLREYKDTIDRYVIRYNITKKLDQLRNRIEKWCDIYGHDNMSYQKEIKDNKTGEYTYRYSDWEFVDDHYGLMINDWDWLPHPKTYKLYNELWKQYIIKD